MRFSASLRIFALRLSTLTCLLSAALALPAATSQAAIHIKNRTVNEPLVLDQNEDYLLDKVYISGITDLSALTLTGRINSVTLTQCSFGNVWSAMGNKAACTESQGAIVGSFSATDSAFEDAQHQLICLREGAFGIVNFTRCRFRTTDQFLKKIYAADPWRTSPPTTEFANIDRLELIDNEYSNTVLVIHSSVKLVIFRGDAANIRLQSPETHVIRLEKDQDPALIAADGTAIAAATESEAAPRSAQSSAPAETAIDARGADPVATPAPSLVSLLMRVIAPDGACQIKAGL